jgi:hypothetical protein
MQTHTCNIVKILLWRYKGLLEPPFPIPLPTTTAKPNAKLKLPQWIDQYQNSKIPHFESNNLLQQSIHQRRVFRRHYQIYNMRMRNSPTIHIVWVLIQAHAEPEKWAGRWLMESAIDLTVKCNQGSSFEPMSKDGCGLIVWGWDLPM